LKDFNFFLSFPGFGIKSKGIYILESKIEILPCRSCSNIIEKGEEYISVVNWNNHPVEVCISCFKMNASENHRIIERIFYHSKDYLRVFKTLEKKEKKKKYEFISE